MWTSDFLDQIATQRMRPRWVVEPVEGTSFEPVSSAFKLSSHREPGYNEVLSAVGNSFGGGRIEVGTWIQSVSEMTLGIRAAVDIRPLVARGQFVVVRMGFVGWDIADYQPIFHGHVQSINRTGDSWSVTLRSLVASLVSRLTEEPDPALFSELAEVTIDAIQFNVVVGIPDGGLTVDDASSAEAETGGEYLLQVFPVSGDPWFFLRATSLAADTFTIDTSSMVLGTTWVTAGIGSTVKILAYIHDNPTGVATKVLVSTGAGTNGAYDTLPETWGLGFPETLIDIDDVELTELIVDPPGPGQVWDVYSVETQDDGLTWLTGVLQPAGVVVCERQGLLTIRAVSPPYDRPYGFETITDDDLVSLQEEAWSSSQPVEITLFSVVCPTQTDPLVSGLLEDPNSRPASEIRLVDLTYVGDNAGDWCDSVAERCGPWSTRLASTVTVTCRGLRLAALAPCDSVVIDSRHYVPRDGADLPSMMVLSVSPDWWRGTVTIVAGYVPETASEH